MEFHLNKIFNSFFVTYRKHFLLDDTKLPVYFLNDYYFTASYS